MKKTIDKCELLAYTNASCSHFIQYMSAIINHSCKEELREASLKVTPARLAVLTLLEQTDTPLDAPSIIEYLQKNKINADPATVFRMMSVFTNKGITKQLEFGEGKFRYEKVGDEHHHLICEMCGQVSDISDCNIKGLEKEIQKKKDFLVKRHSLEFFGLCKNCQQ